MPMDIARRRCALMPILVALPLSVIAACAGPDPPLRTMSANEIDVCAHPGVWIEPAGRRALSPGTVIEDMARRSSVLLGESHPNPEHHRWQLQTLAMLYAANASMVVGFEMIPRSKQPVLDRWVGGELSEQDFLRLLEWDRVWGYDAGLYLPLLHFQRLNRIPAVALNVERELVSRVRRIGWDAVPMVDRAGLGNPVAAREGYRSLLADVYARQHVTRHRTATAVEKVPQSAANGISEVSGNVDFERFVEAQLTWDRAFAQGMVEGRIRHRAELVVGIMGRAHVVHGFGVLHQLSAMGVDDVGTLVPTEVGKDCEEEAPDVADALFTVPAWLPDRGSRPQLGVYLADNGTDVVVTEVVVGSVAESAGIQAGDLVLTAAGQRLDRSSQLIATVRRQVPGTWLPVRIRRGKHEVDLVAKFPAGTSSQ